MPSISEMQYGYDTTGLESYLEEIKTGALQNAKDTVTELSDINTCLDAEWEGKAKENFKENLAKDAQHVSDQFEALYGILQSEVTSVQAAMANKDEVLITVD